MKQKISRTTEGFTIVELLIVIIVIGILATLTLIAYNNVQKQAQASTAKNDLEQIAKQLNYYKETSGNGIAYPANTSTLTYSSGTGVQYSVNNAASPATYCVTATNGNQSFYISNGSTAPTAGGCPGHGVGGQPAVTNFAQNPNAETDGTSNLASMGSQGTAYSRDTTFKYAGNGSFKIVSTGASAGTKWMYTSMASGAALTWSAYVYSSTAITLQGYGEATAGPYTPISAQGGSMNVPANAWTRIWWTGTQPTGTTAGGVGFLMTGGNGQQLWVDNVMIATGSTIYNYGDGSSPSWIWNGSANLSTSSGPAL